MTQSQLNTHIIYIQNQYWDFVYNKYLAKLKIGKICKEAELAMLVVRKYLKYLYKYQPLEDDITYAYSFTIERLTEDSVDLEIVIGLDTFTYSGTGTLEDILESFETDILDSSNYEFEVEIIDGVLYVYSFDNTLSFGTTTTVSTSEEEYATIEEENLQNSYCEILLDNKNCLTIEQLCGIIKHSTSIMSDCSC